MTEKTDQQAQARRPEADNREAWATYWRVQGTHWRTEPEISTERQTYLSKHRATAANIVKGVYPFKNVEPKLTRADIEWLLITHESAGLVGPVDAALETHGNRIGLDLRGANLTGLDLSGLPLTRVIAGLNDAEWKMSDPHPEWREMAAVNLRKASLNWTHLEESRLAGVHLEGAKLRGAVLVRANLIGAQLYKASLAEAHIENARLLGANLKMAFAGRAICTGTQFAQAHLQGARLTDAELVGADFSEADLKGANLSNANLRWTSFFGTRLEQANLSVSHLSGARFLKAHMEGASLHGAILSGSRWPDGDLEQLHTWVPLLPDRLHPCEFRGVFFDAATDLEGVMLGNNEMGTPSFLDVHWGDVNLAVINWSPYDESGWSPGDVGHHANWVPLGNDRSAREHLITHKHADGRMRTTQYIAAVRANLQLATVLRGQGMTDGADRYAYQARLLQRTVLWHRRHYWSFLGSWFLELVAGYGYKPGRALVWYLAIITGFTSLYWHFGVVNTHAFNPLEALVFSITSFHGRGFFPGALNLDSPITVLAAGEAVIGLFIEISFIATFTQRFFSK
jgi:uncharacterized protein YjbI with pentapeptide repeats